MPTRRRVTFVIDETIRLLKDLAEKGTQGLDCSERSLAILNSWEVPFQPYKPAVKNRRNSASGIQPVSSCEAEPVPVESADVSIPLQVKDSLEALRRDIGDCHRCKLAKGRTHIVFGDGNPSARLMFIGEAPGYDEDQQGKPFVGKAGQLLTRIIQAMDMTREQVYIGNVIKCRPPGNRNPEPDEIAACSPFLKRQISIIQPDFICALGTFSAQSLLNTSAPISKLRGQFYDYQGTLLLPTFHPSYLLRNPEKKREVWEDMKLLMNEMLS